MEIIEVEELDEVVDEQIIVLLDEFDVLDNEIIDENQMLFGFEVDEVELDEMVQIQVELGVNDEIDEYENAVVYLENAYGMLEVEVVVEKTHLHLDEIDDDELDDIVAKVVELV